MRLAQARIEGFLCLEDVTLNLNELTILLGSNSTGKSSVLKALRFFFEGERLSPEDVFGGDPDGRVSVQVTFDHLSNGDREVFGPYATGELMVLRRTWEAGEVQITGRGLRYSGFDTIRALSGVSQRKAFQALAITQPDLGLPMVERVDEARDAMLAWEMEHPDQCDAVSSDAASFFGYPSVGQRRLADRFRFVFVAGLRDASEDATERKGTILERLLAAIADQRAEATEALAQLEVRWRDEYEALVEKTHRPTLDALAERLGEQMRRYVPSAEITLDPEAGSPTVAAPRVLLRGGEERHLTDLSRQGHGFQRTFIIAALEYLASVQDFDDPERPTLFLAVEEPELYQHPPRAMHFARTLRDLAFAPGSSVQVCYATHSPYFVNPTDFSCVRICRRTAHPDGESAAPTTITAADPARVAELLPEGDRRQIERRLSSTLRSGFRDAFFARAVLLVEGETDIAVFSEAARRTGRDLASYGVVSVAVSKSVVPVAHAILASLGIPTFVVFDADNVAQASVPCEVCGRGGRDVTNDGRQNAKILAALGETPVDFPPTQLHERWACFAIDLEAYLDESIPAFSERTRTIASDLGWKQKSPEVYVEALTQLEVDELPSLLVSVPQALLALAAGGGD